MKSMSNISAEDATILVLSHNPSGPIKAMIKAQLIRGTRNQIMIKARAEKNTAWTPELVIRRMHKDSDPKIFVCYELAGIDEAKLLEIARQALQNTGIKCPGVVSTTLIMPTRGGPKDASGVTVTLGLAATAGAPAAKKSGILTWIRTWIKNIFWG